MRPPAAKLIFAAVLAGATLSAQPVRVHPHVFAEASLAVAVNSDRTVGTLKHLWRFDDLFSSTVLVEFDENKDLKLDAAELEELASVIYQSLAEFNYFQVVTVDGKDVGMVAPDKLVADFQDNQLLILFESKPASALPLTGTLGFGVYDPTFYTAIDFVEDGNMTVENKPEDCASAVVRPDPDEAIAQNQENLTEAFFNDPGGNDLSRIFATRLEITCKGNG